MYHVIILPEAFADLSKIDKATARRIRDKLKWLAQNLDNLSPLPLRGKFSGLYKLRIGDWRVIYEIDPDQMIITVHKVGHRRYVYR